MTLGFDTGPVHRFVHGDVAVKKIWDRISAGNVIGVISCITLYELQKLGLKGSLPKRSVDRLTLEIPKLFRVVWLKDLTLLRRAAHVSHGNDLSMADAIILVSLMDAGAETIYTTDSDLQRFRSGPDIEVL